MFHSFHGLILKGFLFHVKSLSFEKNSRKIENFRETRPSRFADSTVLKLRESALTQFLSAARGALYSGVLSSVVPMTILLSSPAL